MNKKCTFFDYVAGILLGCMLFLGGSVAAVQFTPPGDVPSVQVAEGP